VDHKDRKSVIRNGRQDAESEARMIIKIGDKVRMTTLTWGELITDRKGKPIHQTPSKDVYEGVVTYVGPECPNSTSPSAEVVRCTGGNTAMKLNTGFSFYPKENGAKQVLELM
jgi:hypothetical protein